MVQPLTWVFILLVLAWRCNRDSANELRRKRSKKYLISGVLTLYLFSNQAIFYEVSRAYESSAKDETELKENYQAAIILGGMVNKYEEHDLVAFAESSDRFLAILPLYKNRQVQKLIITGGSGTLDQEIKEADILKKYLISIGIPTEDILIENKSRNTHENALNTSELITKEELEGPFLLSTSALHMPRAKKCFKKLGINFDTFPVDHLCVKRELNLQTLFIPQSDVIVKWKRLLHEWIGLLSYQVRGYV